VVALKAEVTVDALERILPNGDEVRLLVTMG